ncbi:DMT family transporter [Rahnella bonaserana]|jgi:DME family drug/metabolite transporter|uniref:DMT family transporter n=1 Tax=Rahnella bonaserana TaxID=2816248 RepID=UPI0024C434A6|nr:DMT family transporter [Rahnella bonaserana]MCL9641340.1 DMT family transporter [Rahnella victoriana]WHZ38814.1 DMT family transporter [Rahnella bonaserana]
MVGRRERMLGIFAVLFASVLWGSTGTAATFAPDVSPLAIGAVAMGLGGLLQALISAKGIIASRQRFWQNRGMLVTGALAVGIYPLAFYASMHLAGVTVGTVISIGSAPLLSALIEYSLDGQRLSRRWMSGAAIGVAGMILLCVAESTGHSAAGQGSGVIIGIGLGLIAGLTYALYSWAARHLMQRGIGSRAAMGATFGLGGVFLMPVLFATGAPLLASWNNAAVGAYMALIPMFVGYVCFGYALARIPASMATTITLLEPAVAAVLAVLIVGERLPALGWTGIGLVIACLIFITVPLKRRRALPVSA